MARKVPEQNPNNPKGETQTPARLIKDRMRILKMTQKELAKGIGMSESKMSRIMRDSTTKGDTYAWTEADINLIAIGLEWGTQGRDKLRYAIYPELVCYDEALRAMEGVIRLNCRLDDCGFPLVETKEE